MGRHLILTIHGVGEQRPGETVDQVVGAATTWVDHLPRPAVEVNRDMIELAEGHFDGTSRNARLFPVHLCRVTETGNGQDEALFTEVFWADRSPAPKGLINTLLDLIWVVLALGYLAMDNVEQTHQRSDKDPSDPGGRATFAAKIVHLFTWVFFGVVATLNLYLLVGAIPAMTDQIFKDVGLIRKVQFGALAALYAGGIAGGLIYWNSASTYLRRVFWRGMVFAGGFLLLALIFGPQMEEWWQVDTGHDPLGQFVGMQIVVLGGAWAIQSLLTVLMVGTALLPLKLTDGIAGHRRLYPSICAGMLVLWMFFISGLWLTLQTIVESTPGLETGELSMLFQSHLQEAIDSVSVVFVAMVLLVVVGAVIFALRKVLKTNLHARHPYLKRAILNRVAQAVFVGAGLVLALIALRTGLVMFADVDFLCPKSADSQDRHCQGIGPLLDKLAEHKAQIGLIVVAIMALIYRFTDVVAAGLGVARDIVTYAKRDACALWEDRTMRCSNYPDRSAIEERFFRVFYYALQVFDADKITVISHSQGTVVATQMLADKRVQRRIGNRPVTLITMGAPVTHIYQKYFPEMFTVDPSKLPARWFNIFREDDFVGTTIDGGHIASDRNIAVPPRGHTGYFTDYEVWKKLCGDEIGFDLFHPKT